MAKAGDRGPFHPFHQHPQQACLIFGLGKGTELRHLGRGLAAIRQRVDDIPSHSGLLKVIRGW